jgi:hypothetical protein
MEMEMEKRKMKKLRNAGDSLGSQKEGKLYSDSHETH